MTKETVDALLLTIIETAQMAAASRTKWIAFESVLRDHNPALHEQYARKIESLQNARGPELNREPLEALRAMLLRE